MSGWPTVGQWQATKDLPVDRQVTMLLPAVFSRRPEVWSPLLTHLDETTSDPAVWDLLADLVIASNAKVIVEAGTYRGHATMAMAEALAVNERTGMIFTADIEDHHVLDVVSEVGLESYVHFYHGRFEDMLAEITEPIDFAFIDASNPTRSAQRIEHINLVIPKLAPWGLIVADDCLDVPENLWSGAAALRDACHLYLPVGRGLAIFQKKDNE